MVGGGRPLPEILDQTSLVAP